jgi:hypothetical protein
MPPREGLQERGLRAIDNGEEMEGEVEARKLMCGLARLGTAADWQDHRQDHPQDQEEWPWRRTAARELVWAR